VEKAKLIVCATTVVIMIVCALSLISFTSSSAGAAQAKDLKEHWRFHDGHWGYYYPADKRWYYTDGNHWFFEDKGAWKLYPFDREFGKGEHFEKAGYKAPGVELKIKLPTHGVFRL
jgi:hypothetical protein